MMGNCTVVKAAGIAGAAPFGKLNPLWTPALLPGLVDGWESESGVTEDGSHEVTQWTGVNSTKLTAAAGVTPNRSRNMNGKNGLVFSGDLAKTSAALTTTAAPICLYGVWDMLTDPDATQQTIVSCDAIGIHLNFPGASNILVVNGNNPAGNVSPGAGFSPVGRHIFVYYQPAAGSAVLRIDGVQVATKASGVVNTTIGALRAGRFFGDQANTATLDTALGAFGIAASLQTLADVQKLEGYLAQGWAGSSFLPADHPHRSTPPRRLT